MDNVNRIIKDFNFSKSDAKKLHDGLIKELGICVMPYRAISLKKDTRIFRCRKHEVVGIPFRSVSDLSYRTDLHNISNYGRCNLPLAAKFYGAINTLSLNQGYLTSISETSRLFRDDIDGYERYSIGMWVLKEDIDLFFAFPPTNINNGNKTLNHILGQKEILFSEPALNESQKEFFELVGSVFSKKVKSNENYQYMISAILSDIFLKDKNINGIAYPSVQTEYNGINVAIVPAVFDAFFKFSHLAVVDIFKIGDHISIQNLFESFPGKYYPLEFKPISEGEFKPFSEILNEFHTLGYSKEKIIEVFLKQLGKDFGYNYSDIVGGKIH